jgi:hypothetical protein
MCTTDERDEIVAEILAAQTGMPARYAAWFVAQLTDDQRTYVTRAAVKRRRAAVRLVQDQIHRRLAKQDPCFPENIARDVPPQPPDKRRAARRRKRRDDGPQLRLFAV